MDSNVEPCTRCVMIEAKLEMISVEFSAYKAKYKEAIERANKYTKDDPEYNPH